MATSEKKPKRTLAEVEAALRERERKITAQLRDITRKKTAESRRKDLHFKAQLGGYILSLWKAEDEAKIRDNAKKVEATLSAPADKQSFNEMLAVFIADKKAAEADAKAQAKPEAKAEQKPAVARVFTPQAAAKA